LCIVILIAAILPDVFVELVRSCSDGATFFLFDGTVISALMEESYCWGAVFGTVVG
jgi:hypothetical protein